MSCDMSAAEQRKVQRRWDIITAATRLFATLGYSACDMEQVAGELKIAKGTLYLYFAGKQELFLSCVDQGMLDLQKRLEESVALRADPYERIACSIWTFLEFFDQFPEHVELLIQERAMFRDRDRPTVFVYRQTRRERWREIYSQLIADGKFRDDLSVDDLVDTVGNLLYGTMFTNYFSGRSIPLCQQYRALVELSFRGLLSDSERARLSGVSFAALKTRPSPQTG
jgi:AcrR family transcriptional regulator